MVNMNEIISSNIMNIMKQSGKKQTDLAGYLGVSKQVVSKMLSLCLIHILFIRLLDWKIHGFPHWRYSGLKRAASGI